MKKHSNYTKRYTAQWDNGHDTGYFFYYSYSRANSKQKLEDAIVELVSKHGERARYRKITDFRRIDEA